MSNDPVGDPERESEASGASGGEQDDLPPASAAAQSNGDARPASVGENDVAWAVPEGVMWPLAAAFAGLMVWAFGFDLVLLSTVPLAALLGVITVIDLRELRIPKKLTRPATLVGIPLVALSTLSDWIGLSLPRAALGALVLGAIYLVMHLIHPAGMGGGDVKLAFILGGVLGMFGWIPVARAVLLAHLIAGPVALLLIIVTRRRRGIAFPFGPFLVVGALIALVLEGRGY